MLVYVYHPRGSRDEHIVAERADDIGNHMAVGCIHMLRFSQWERQARRKEKSYLQIIMLRTELVIAFPAPVMMGRALEMLLILSASLEDTKVALFAIVLVKSFDVLSILRICAEVIIVELTIVMFRRAHKVLLHCFQGTELPVAGIASIVFSSRVCGEMINIRPASLAVSWRIYSHRR